jgi:hypothetical protein
MVTQSLYRNLQEIPVGPDGQLPKNLRELIEVGGVEALVQAAGEHTLKGVFPEDSSHIPGARQLVILLRALV